jgi:hypothetical protein
MSITRINIINMNGYPINNVEAGGVNIVQLLAIVDIK